MLYSEEEAASLISHDCDVSANLTEQILLQICMTSLTKTNV